MSVRIRLSFNSITESLMKVNFGVMVRSIRFIRDALRSKPERIGWRLASIFCVPARCRIDLRSSILARAQRSNS